MDRLVKMQFENTRTLERIQLDINRRFCNSVIELIEVMQEGVGYVAFNDESGFPEITLFGETYEVYGVMVRPDRENEHKMLCVYTNGKEIDDMPKCEITDTYGGWFTRTHTMDYNELFDCLTSIIEKDYED